MNFLIKIPAILIALVFTIQLSAQTQTTTFSVSGNCEMCKKRIEAAAKKSGATTAIWSAEQQMVVVSYDATKTSPQKVGEAIAKAGYDNQYATGDAAAYKKLPACCKYTRKTE